MIVVELVHQPETRGRGSWLVEILAGSPPECISSTHFTSRAHAGAFKRGAIAYRDRSPRENPYKPGKSTGLGKLGLRGFRNAWYEGCNTMMAAEITCSRLQREKPQ